MSGGGGAVRPRIRRLPDHLVNKIAAGEVVERPASVVKELVENSLDAGSEQITVDLRDAGRQLVRVADDGAGMTAEEVDLALLRHATSKIAEEADLGAIATLGFRGEALPAICAVTRFSLLSCARGSEQGTLVRGEGGVVAGKFVVPAPPGTTVETQDLFFNTPARLKFLKTAQTELGLILRLLEGVALARPGVRWRVSHNGRPLLTAPRARTLRERAGALWGFEGAERLLDVEHAEGTVRVDGLVGPPQLARGGRDRMILIVNGRPVRDTVLAQTVLDAYRPLLPRDQFPVAVLAIELPPAEVDVNVHPTKAWVRFRAPRAVQEVLWKGVERALRSTRVVAPQPGLSTPTAAAVEAAFGAEPRAAAEPGLFAEPNRPWDAPRFGAVIGQLQDTFIVSATEEEVFFIDQHVAHERVLFERLRRDCAAGPLASQELLFPRPLDLGAGETERLLEWAPTLERLGFALEGFGGSSVVLRAVPVLLKGEEPRRLVERLLEEVSPAGREAPLFDRALAFVACRAAVKAHAPLERQEMARLVADLSAAETPFFCPHGRPIVSRLSLRDIKKELGRTW